MNGTTTSYTLHGKLIIHMKKGSDNLHFFYDAQSRPAKVNLGGTMYTYIHNLQGDIVGILDKNGTLVVEYKYDAWGKKLSVIGSLATTLGTLNPFRYRGYIYDEETGLYYLRTRYYNPSWGRFLNADTLEVLHIIEYDEEDHILSNNIFAYCVNNPICCDDQTGTTGAPLAILFVGIGGLAAAPWFVVVLIGIAVIGIAGALINLAIFFAKGHQGNMRDTGLEGLPNRKLKEMLKDPNIPKDLKRRLQKEQKARGLRNVEKRSGYKHG